MLKKTPNLQCGRALKGYALFRLGRAEECSAIINQIMNEDPIDNSTMSVLSFVFKETDDCKLLLTIFDCIFVAGNGSPCGLTKRLRKDVMKPIN